MNKTTDTANGAATVEDHGTIPVVEEHLQINKLTVDEGVIRIRKKTEERVVDVPLVSTIHTHSIERRAVNEYVESPPEPVRYEGKTMVVSVLEEEVVLVKRLKLVEEIRITPIEEQIVNTTQVTLKRERVVVEKEPPINGK